MRISNLLRLRRLCPILLELAGLAAAAPGAGAQAPATSCHRQHRRRQRLALPDRSQRILKLLGSTTLSGGETLGSVDARLSPDGATLSVADSKAAAVSALAASAGGLSELGCSPTRCPRRSAKLST
jgi:hypothetical protein